MVGNLSSGGYAINYTRKLEATMPIWVNSRFVMNGRQSWNLVVLATLS